MNQTGQFNLIQMWSLRFNFINFPNSSHLNNLIYWSVTFIIEQCCFFCYNYNTKVWIWPSGKLSFDCQKIAKKLPKTWHFFQKYCQKFSFFSKKLHGQFFVWKKWKFLAIFWQSNGNFPEGQTWSNKCVVKLGSQ